MGMNDDRNRYLEDEKKRAHDFVRERLSRKSE